MEQRSSYVDRTWGKRHAASSTRSRSLALHPRPTASPSPRRTPSPASPPTYAVVERSKGRYYAPGLGVCWPDRPSRGAYSLADYWQRRQRRDRRRSSMWRARRRGASERSSSVPETCSGRYKAPNLDVYWPERPMHAAYSVEQRGGRGRAVSRNKPPSVCRHQQRPSNRHRLPDNFAGVRAAEEAEAMLERGDFVLYYPRPPERVGRNGRLATVLQLTVAYRTSKGAFRHYLVRLLANGNFYVDCGATRPANFADLRDLVRFHNLHTTINPSGPPIDTFPWWLTPVLGDRVTRCKRH